VTAKKRPRGTKSRELKERGIRLVTENEKREWREAAHVYIAKLPYGLRMTGEDIRVQYFRECNPGEPHHPSVWGAVINHCVWEGFLAETGVFVKSKPAKRHSNVVPVWLTGAWKKPRKRRDQDE